MMIQQTSSNASILRKVFAWILSLIFFFNFISHSSDCLDIIHTQFLTDIFDMRIHDLLIPVILISPHAVQKTPPGKHFSRIFQKQLQDLGVNATVRRRLGTDISAACGQLRREAQKGGGA